MIIDKQTKLKNLHEKAKPIFSKFLSEVEAAGYNVRINEVLYSYEDGVKLHSLNTKNPIFSYHTYGFAVDMNITSVDTGRMFMKADTKEDWELTGIPKIAKDNGLFWGGDYLTYHDPIHFEYQIMPFAKLRAESDKQFSSNTEVEFNKIKL